MIQYSKSENETINKKLMELIRRHQETILMNTHMVELFFVNIFSHFVSAALVLCCVSVNLLLVSDMVVFRRWVEIVDVNGISYLYLIFNENFC